MSGNPLSESSKTNNSGSSVKNSLLRIISEQYAQAGEFPYMVSIRIANRHTCGGSIISQNTILTAAHCVRHYVPGGDAYYNFNKLSVVTGTVALASGGNSYTIRAIHIHPSYSSKESSSDIAVIKVSPLYFLCIKIEGTKEFLLKSKLTIKENNRIM